MGLVAVNTLYDTVPVKELKTINRNLHDKPIMMCIDADTKSW